MTVIDLRTTVYRLGAYYGLPGGPGPDPSRLPGLSRRGKIPHVDIIRRYYQNFNTLDFCIKKISYEVQ